MLLNLLVWILAVVHNCVVSGNSVLDANGVRLVGGTGPYGGRVEIRIKGIWGTICDGSFDIREAKVLCRMMNLSATTYFTGAQYGQGNGPIFADRLTCNGRETHIRECSFVTNTLCYHSRDVAIICTACGQFNVYNGKVSVVSANGNVLTTSCNSGLVSNMSTVECKKSGTWSVRSLSCKVPMDPGYPLPISDIRLSNGVGLYDGRIEVLVNKTWGTVCGSSFTVGDARAICNILGYSTNYRKYYISSYPYGQGSGPIYIDKLECTGSEHEINKCTYHVNNSCSHGNDAAVACNKNALNITDIRLVNGTGLYDGRVELFVDGIWGTICGYDIDTYAAQTLCNMKGGLRVRHYRSTAHYGEGTGPILVSNLRCRRRWNHIKHCSYYSPERNTCTHRQDVSIMCSPCDKDEISHVSSVDFINDTNYIARCNKGFWPKTIPLRCFSNGSWDYEEICTSRYACDKDEILHVSSVDFINDTSYIAKCNKGFRPQRIPLRCFSNGSWDYEETCTSRYGYPLEIRQIKQSNYRVEINVDGEWGTLCNTNFDSSGAKVLCRMLGLNYDRIQYNCAGSGPIYLDNLRCNGTESHINNCTYNVTNRCFHHNDVCVACTRYPLNVSTIQLSRGPYHGRIELEIDKVWGTVCDHYFYTNEANVICRMLGYKNGGIRLLNAYYGAGSGPIYVDYLSCSGTESHINECRYNTKANCRHNKDVSVICKVDINITDARLVNGTGPYDGRAEIKVNGTWGTICGTNFDQTRADSFCNMLGLKATQFYTDATYGQGHGPVYDIYCQGNDIRTCLYLVTDKCSHNKDVSVVCSECGKPDIDFWGVDYFTYHGKTLYADCSYYRSYVGNLSMTCDNDTNEWVTEGECQEYAYPLNITDIRLSNGNRSSRGRVEIQSIGFWGTICDDSFGMAEANVICSMVGYPRAVSFVGNAYYGKGKGPIFADDLECEQNTTHINNCKYATYDNCQHSDDVSVICTDCGDPKPAHGFANASDTRLHTVIQVQCEQGYRLIGSSVIECMETNNWSAHPACKLIDCGDPSPANGARNSTETANGTVVQVSCDNGYDLSGNALITCQPNDTWTDYPTCEIIDCGWPKPSNADVDLSNNVTTFGAIAVISCITGYRPGGKISVSCIANGSWEAWPQCELIDCGDPTPNKGYRNDTKTTYASVVEITCDKGLKMSGNSTLVCRADGTWSDNPVCDTSDCGKLSVSQGTVNTSFGTTTGALVSVSCNEGYDLDGPNIVACTVRGWNETVSCVLKDCGDPTPNNGKLISTEGTKFGNKVEIACDVGHELIGDRTITCQDSGVWSQTPVCRMRDCEEPVNYPSNGKWNDEEGTKYNATIRFDCNDGYLLVGEKMIFCQSNGTWSGSPPTCALKAPVGGHCLNNEHCKTIKAVCEQAVCTCKTGIHDEITDTCDTMPLFPYGKDNGDIVLSKKEVCGPKIMFAPGIPLFDKMHKELYVCSNGLISFDSEYNIPTPPNDTNSIPDFGNRSLLAPFYTQIDKYSGSVYYRTYDIHKSFAKFEADIRLIYKTEDTIRKFGAVKSFETSFILLATWDGLKPMGKEYDKTKTSTFQAVLASDGSSTFTFFIYGQGLMQWIYKGASPLRMWVGYTINSLNYTHPFSFSEQKLSPDVLKQSIPGSFNGVAGLIFKPLTRDGEQNPNHAVDCIKWYNNNLKEKEHTRIITSRLPHCPCDIWLSRYDPWFWNIDRRSKDPYTCVDMFPGQIYQPYGKSCCYDLSTWSWISHRPVAGGFYRFHPQKFSPEHIEHDVIPKQKCCELSKYCDLYYELHPIGACYKKLPYDMGVFWGDPHFWTLDGMSFTFNGLGEYTLLKLHTDDVTFELQARTERARKINGEKSDATVFCAFAAKESSNASVHVQLNKAKNGIIIYGNYQDLTSKFSNYTDTMHPFTYTSIEGNLILSKRDGALDVYFPLSDISLNISVSVEMLSLITTIAKKWHNMTTGLLGNYDGNPKNDFSLPNGTILSANMSEREVFAYGKTWKINPNNSAFIYDEGKSHFNYHNETYIPRFLNEVDSAKVLEAENFCNGSQNIECIFDFVFTENPEIAENSNRIKRESETIRNEMNETVPNVTGCETVNTQIGQNVTCEVTLEEGNDIHFIENNVHAEYNKEVSAITYFQQDDSPVNLRFSARNLNGRFSPPFIMSILLCTGCNGRGKCSESPREDPRETEYFKYASCICDPEYEGLDCEHEFDACSANPCSLGRNCTKIPTEERRSFDRTYKCSSCPPGFTSKADDNHSDECLDVDECLTDLCEHYCTNTEGSYICKCREGYRVDTRNSSLCRDINECDEALHNCSQICNNTESGFNCTCYPGFYFDSSTWSCQTTGASKCTSVEEKMCQSKNSDCAKLNGNARCFCKAGFEWNEATTTCDDINECERNVCPQNCINTVGSFLCECFIGYMLQNAATCKQCDVQYWGKNCSQECDCTGQGATRCDPVKGCICANGWEGAFCNVDINECDLVGDICKDPKKLCVNKPGAYRCNCRSGYLETNEGICEDVNECSFPLMNDCMQQCTNTVGGYTCGCFDGFTRQNATHCIDIDECELGTAGCEQVCKNSPGLFSCYCHNGYTLNDDRKSCMKVSDPCKAISNLDCSHYCFVKDNNATCCCQKGYTLGTDGQTCLDINECENGICDTGADCMNTEGHYVCKCPMGKRLENDGRTCTGCGEFHYGEECSQTCSCLHGVCDSVTGCKCKDGWTGINCDIDKNECETGSIKCIEENTMCVNTAGSAACVCNAGYANISGICKDIDECQATTLNLCDQTCSNTEGSYRCGCHRGFVYLKGKCTDISECQQIDECDQICENTIGSYRCLCEPGFRLNLTDRKSCIVNSECSLRDINKCGRNASCYIINGHSDCKCNKGFHDVNGRCDDIDECASDKHVCSHSCNNTVSGYKCHCPVGFSLRSDKVTCTECNEGTYGSNCTLKCTCVTANTDTCDGKTGSCKCIQGWKGKDCDQDIDECKQIHNCPVNSHCVNNNGSYECRCEKGYITSGNGKCEECGNSHYGDNCVEECRCDLRSTDSCNHITGNCSCKKGWKGNTCTEDIDECKADADPCQEVSNSSCSNTIGSYACVCQRGYNKKDNKCKDVDECLLGKDDCVQQCVNTMGSYRCNCHRGYKGTWNDCSVETETKSSTKPVNVPIIIGASGGGFVLIVAMIVVIVFLRKRIQGQKLDQRLHRLRTASDLAKGKEGTVPPKVESNYYHILKWQENLPESEESKRMTLNSMSSRFTMTPGAESVYDQPYKIPRARIQQSAIAENDYLTLS